jgi:hypothetical protein
MGEKMTYSLNGDVRREFKSVLEAGTVITDDKIVEFQLANFALINSYLATRYSVPVVGTSPVNQKTQLVFTAAAGSGELYQVKTNMNEMKKTYSFTTLAAMTDLQLAQQFNTLILADVNRLVEPEVVGNNLVLESKVLGMEFSTELTINIVGSSCKIAGILKTKVAEKMSASGVRQEIKDESCGKQALAILKDLQDGKAVLTDIPLATTSGGLESSAYAGTFKVGVQQW